MENLNSIDIRAISIQVFTILETDNIIQLNGMVNLFIEDVRVINEKNLYAVQVFEEYKSEKRKWRGIHHDLKEFQIQQAVLEYEAKLNHIKVTEIHDELRECKIQLSIVEFRSKFTNINLRWEKADIGCKLDFQGFARDRFKILLQRVNHIHLKNMLIKSVYMNKMKLLELFGNSKMPMEVMNIILQYTSLALVWVNWMELQDDETLDNTSKFFKRNSINNVNESSLRPWHVDFLNNVSSHSWSRISK
jgi:hypothetical protein